MIISALLSFAYLCKDCADGSFQFAVGHLEHGQELGNFTSGRSVLRRCAVTFFGLAQSLRMRFVCQARQAYQQAVSLDASQHGCLANLAQLEAHLSFFKGCFGEPGFQARTPTCLGQHVSC